MRRLAPEEVWRVQGGQPEDWRAKLEQGYKEAELLKSAAQACPLNTASVLVNVAGAVLAGEQNPRRAGLCQDPDNENGWEAVRHWLKAWKKRELKAEEPPGPEELARLPGKIVRPPCQTSRGTTTGEELEGSRAGGPSEKREWAKKKGAQSKEVRIEDPVQDDEGNNPRDGQGNSLKAATAITPKRVRKQPRDAKGNNPRDA